VSGSTRGPFVASLESLRGIAALLVALFHIPFTNFTYDWPVVRNGYLLVDLFFVLSGWVMAQAYGGRLRTAQDVKTYLWLRLGRIYPLHLTLLGVFFAIEVARAVAQARGQALATPAFSTNGPWALVCNVLLVHAHGLTHALSFNGPSWSIGAELWAYVSFAALSLAPVTPKTRLAMATVTAASLFSLIYLWHPSSIDVTFDGGVLRCLAGFALGLLTHAVSRMVPPRVGSLLGLLGVALTFAVLHFSAEGSLDFAFPLAAAVLIAGIASAPEGGLSKALASRPLVWLGKVSFSLYMVHTAVIRIVAPVVRRLSGAAGGEADGLLRVSPAWGLMGLVLFVAVLLATSALSYRFVEDPARRWAKARVS
jgi:peptidoglycan/LPS O-acetylase OafA/YrhL